MSKRRAYCSVLQCVAERCSALQCVVVYEEGQCQHEECEPVEEEECRCRSVSQCVAVCCSALQCKPVEEKDCLRRSALQCVAVRCSVSLWKSVSNVILAEECERRV